MIGAGVSSVWRARCGLPAPSDRPGLPRLRSLLQCIHILGLPRGRRSPGPHSCSLRLGWRAALACPGWRSRKGRRSPRSSCVNELAVVPSTAKELPIRRKALRLGKAAIWRHHTVPIHLVCHPVHTGVSNRASTQIQSEPSSRSGCGSTVFLQKRKKRN